MNARGSAVSYLVGGIVAVILFILAIVALVGGVRGV